MLLLVLINRGWQLITLYHLKLLNNFGILTKLSLLREYNINFLSNIIKLFYRTKLNEYNSKFIILDQTDSITFTLVLKYICYNKYSQKLINYNYMKWVWKLFNNNSSPASQTYLATSPFESFFCFCRLLLLFYIFV